MTTIEDGTLESDYHGFPELIKAAREYEQEAITEATQQQEIFQERRDRFVAEQAFRKVVEKGF